ncbi:HEAT repeat domain-containing protein [Methanococcoides seepicolus]|uniref:HEAT repeat domain-containing protein n=1 Tax=Methanococcoides seepicolus TaxID=2828780 RepID=A0A9E4ZFT3_9EURY|nr:HEAT repeat domain-containing protein [Methanococcoides seepicolus]MCM1986339.1 HEAT repeat domain-containing protein [Methanococcoides seepicolus]
MIIKVLILTTAVLIFVTPMTYADAKNLDFENKTTIEILIEDMAVQNVSVSSNAVRSLVDIGEPAVEPLIQALENNNLDIRENSAITLGKIGDKRAVEPLLNLIDDECQEVRIAAEIALGDIGEEHIDLLVTHANNPDKSLSSRKIAIIVLGEYGEKAVPHLIELLSENDDYFTLSGEVRYSLAKIGEPAVDPLIKLLESDDPDVKSSAIKALGDIGDECAIEPLSKALNDESELVRNLAKSNIERIENHNAHFSYVSYGKVPTFYTEDERQEWFSNLEIIVGTSETEMDKYIRPEGSVYSYGCSYDGHISVGIVADSGVNESLMNEIYDIFDQHAQEIGIENVPVLFEYGDIEAGEAIDEEDIVDRNIAVINDDGNVIIYTEDEAYFDKEGNLVIIGNETTQEENGTNKQTPGFTSIMLIIGLLLSARSRK